jgi:hypothetical protein
MGKVTGWMLALIAYKPAAALVYAAGLAFMSDKQHPANFVVGIAVLALSVIALPALMKFFNWTVGATQTGNGMGMFGAGAAAGVHAASSLRGLGGNSAAEHSRYLDGNGPGRPGPAPGNSTGPANPTGSGGPNGSGKPGTGAAPTVVDGAVTSTAPAGPDMPVTPATTVPAGSGATASTGAANTAAGATTSGATTAAGAGGAAATGPAAPVVLGTVVAAQAANQATKAAAAKATDAMGGE